MGTKARVLLSTAMASVIFAGGGTAIAQENQSASTGMLEEIVVQATRRETGLQTTPVAVSAVTESQIETQAPRDLGDIAILVPNFSAARITGFNAASFAMRGVGQNNIIVYYEAPVTVLVDDFVMPSVQTQLLDTFDIEQVEVLRGPQGTLFGKNSVGGAVVVRTKKPELDQMSGEARASFGDFNTFQVQAAVNAPIIEDKLALRVVGSYQNSDGFMKNGHEYGPVAGFAPTKWDGLQGGGDGSPIGGTDVFNGRLKLLWKPADNVNALLQYEMLRDNSDSPATVNETDPDNPGLVFSLLGFSEDPGDPIKRGGLTNRDDNLLNMSDGHQVDVDGVYLNVDVEFDSGTLTSVTGYREQKSRLPSSYISDSVVAPDGERLSLFDANRADNRDTFQQELRFASDFDGAFNFVAGGFYQKDDTDFCVVQTLGFLDLLGVALPFGTFNQNPQVLCNNQEAESYALFAEGNYDVTDRLTLTGGFRYTWDEKTWQGRQQVFFQALEGGFDPMLTWDTFDSPLDPGDFDRYPTDVLEDSEKWKEPTWRASVSYEFSDDVFSYFTYSRGYKGGGYNDQTGTGGAPLVPDQIRPVDPEKADSFELGLKTESFDNRLRVNVTGFYVEYKDIQKQIVVPITRPDGSTFQETRFFNAAKMEVKGIEAEVVAQPIPEFTLRGVLGYQDGKYKEYITPVPAGYDLATAPIDRAPEWQWTIDGTYQTPIEDWGLLTVNANVNYTDRNLFTQSITTPDENTFLDSRTLVNASITMADIDERYYVRLIGKNLTDTRYRTASQVVGGLWAFTLYGPPRQLTAEIGFKF